MQLTFSAALVMEMPTYGRFASFRIPSFDFTLITSEFTYIPPDFVMQVDKPRMNPIALKSHDGEVTAVTWYVLAFKKKLNFFF